MMVFGEIPSIHHLFDNHSPHKMYPLPQHHHCVLVVLKLERERERELSMMVGWRIQYETLCERSHSVTEIQLFYSHCVRSCLLH